MGFFSMVFSLLFPSILLFPTPFKIFLFLKLLQWAGIPSDGSSKTFALVVLSKGAGNVDLVHP